MWCHGIFARVLAGLVVIVGGWATTFAGAGVLVLLTAGCASTEGSAADAGRAPLTVVAASSLTDVFGAVAAEFTEATGVPVRTAFAGSSTLAEQIRGGAPIDVFASAGTAVMDPLVQERLVTDVAAFATNSLTIAVPQGNPADVRALADVPGVSVVMCAVQVPCGTATQQLFEANAIEVQPKSYERDARAVLTKVGADEADAGLVYVTDVISAADDVEEVPIPATANVTTTYQAARVVESSNGDAAARFVEYLNTTQTQEILRAAGFGPPP